MFGQKLAVVALSALGVVSAQSQNFTISPDSVQISTRASWCTAQQNNCDTICGAASANSCDPSTLDYTCKCAGGTTPDLAEYKNTMPFYICQEAADQCNLQHVGDATEQKACTTNIRDKCGKKAPGKESTSEPSSTGSGTATSTGGSSPANTAGNSAPSSTPQDSAAAMPAGVQYLGLAVVGILAALI